MKQILLIITILLLQSCESGQNYLPIQDKNLSVLDNTFFRKNGNGEYVEVEYIHAVKGVIPNGVFGDIIYSALYEAQVSLKYPMTFVPKSIMISENTGDIPFTKYTGFVTFSGKNGFGTPSESKHIAYFNEDGKCTNSSLRVKEEELLKSMGYSKDSIDSIFKTSKGLELPIDSPILKVFK